MNRIKLLREEKNLTQQDLADKLGGAKSTIAMYESGSRKPSLDVLNKLSEIFECSIDYIIGKSDTRNSSSIDNNKILGGLSAKYNKLTDDQKDFVKKTIEMLLEKDN